MDSLLNLIPKDQIVYALLGVLLPSIAGFLLYLKTEKDSIVDFVVDEVDDVLADLNEAKTAIVTALDYAEDSLEGIIQGLSPDSAGGSRLTDEEKAESLIMANRALTELKNAKNKISESIRIGD